MEREREREIHTQIYIYIHMYIYIYVYIYIYTEVSVQKSMLTLHAGKKSESRHPKSGRPQERERYHVEGLFLALRAVDNHVLVFAVRPSSGCSA